MTPNPSPRSTGTEGKHGSPSGLPKPEGPADEPMPANARQADPIPLASEREEPTHAKEDTPKKGGRGGVHDAR